MKYLAAFLNLFRTFTKVVHTDLQPMLFDLSQCHMSSPKQSLLITGNKGAVFRFTIFLQVFMHRAFLGIQTPPKAASFVTVAE
jgi:hypothetical protein